MVGKNAVELHLPTTYSRLHPVFNVSLLMPFLSSDKFIPDQPPPLHDDFPQNFVDWASLQFIMDYRCLQPGLHEYLIRGNDMTGLNDEWNLLTTLSPDLDSFLRQFHQATAGSGPSDEVWRQRSLVMV